MARDSGSKIVKIAVAGDSQVGKTSLVIALTNESFPDVCPPVVPPASLPADLTPEGVPFHVIDTSSRPEQRTTFEQTCITADVVVLLFEAGITLKAMQPSPYTAAPQMSQAIKQECD